MTTVNPFPLGSYTFTGPSAPIVPSRSPLVVPIDPLGGVPYVLAPDVVAAQQAAGVTPAPPATPPPPANDDCNGCRD